jgi:DNA-binding SARP family transcriptional activator
MSHIANRLLDSSDDCSDIVLSHEPLCGELLPDWYEDWVLLERERLQQLRLHALDALTERLISLERYGQAVQVGLKSVQEEPLRESPHRLLVRIHLTEGNLSEAVREFGRYRELLNAELGVEPSERMSSLLEGLVPARRQPKEAGARSRLGGT